MKSWQPDQAKTKGIQFEGAPDLLQLIASLCRRPWRFWRETRLPVVRLVRPSGGPDPLTGLQAWLEAARGTIAYARTGSALSKRKPAVIEDLLDVAVTEFAREFKGPRLRFPHYGLALWLLHLEEAGIAPSTPPDRERDLIARRLQIHLRERVGGNQFGATLADAVGDFPWWVRVTARPLPALALALMRRSWRPPRWFAAQPIAVPYRSSFYGLALQFAKPDFVRTHQNEINKLLVDAFLQDLRVAYRRGNWLGRGRRRTAYPVLLVDADSGASRDLVKLIDDLRRSTVPRHRTQRPLRDPLLVVTDPGTALKSTPTFPSDAQPAYDIWLTKQLAAADDRTGYLELIVPEATSNPGDWRNLGQAGLPRRRRPVMAAVLPLVLMAAVAGVVAFNLNRCVAPWSVDPHRTLQRVSLNGNDSQCIGLSDGSFTFFDDPPLAEPVIAAQLKTVEGLIAASNDTAVQRPDHVTVVYLSTLTNTTVAGYQAALEELRGLALAQRELLTAAVPIRLLLANGGDKMNYGRQAADLIAGAARRLRIVAVTGLGVSRTGVQDALVELDRAGIATLGTLLSADQLTTTVAGYHQVGPTNKREAAVAAYYARTVRKATSASIYYSGDPADIYSSNLADDVQQAFIARGIDVHEKDAYATAPGTVGGDVTSLGQRACSTDPNFLVFFAGRPDDFANFMIGMRGSCAAKYPKMLAGDAITEFVLDHRAENFPGLALDYMSSASGVAWGPECAVAKKQPFFPLYRKYGFGPDCDTGQAVRAMFGWDALHTLEAAAVRVNDLHSDPLAPGAMLHGLDSLTGRDAVNGVTGRIEYSSSGASPQAPVDKAILVVGTGKDGLPFRQMLCGNIPTADEPDEGCPTG